MDTFLLSDFCPAFLQPLCVQVECGGAELYISCSTVGNMQKCRAQQRCLGKGIPSLRVCENPWARSSPCDLCFGGGHGCSGNWGVNIAQVIKCVLHGVVATWRGLLPPSLPQQIHLFTHVQEWEEKVWGLPVSLPATTPLPVRGRHHHHLSCGL